MFSDKTEKTESIMIVLARRGLRGSFALAEATPYSYNAGATQSNQVNKRNLDAFLTKTRPKWLKMIGINLITLVLFIFNIFNRKKWENNRDSHETFMKGKKTPKMAIFRSIFDYIWGPGGQVKVGSGREMMPKAPKDFREVI